MEDEEKINTEIGELEAEIEYYLSENNLSSRNNIKRVAHIMLVALLDNVHLTIQEAVLILKQKGIKREYV